MKGHTGQYLSQKLLKLLQEFGITTKVCFARIPSPDYACLPFKSQVLAVTCDNASNNAKMMKEMKKAEPDFRGPDARVRCFGHVINLVVKVCGLTSVPGSLRSANPRIYRRFSRSLDRRSSQRSSESLTRTCPPWMIRRTLTRRRTMTRMKRKRLRMMRRSRRRKNCAPISWSRMPTSGLDAYLSRRSALSR